MVVAGRTTSGGRLPPVGLRSPWPPINIAALFLLTTSSTPPVSHHLTSSATSTAPRVMPRDWSILVLAPYPQDTVPVHTYHIYEPDPTPKFVRHSAFVQNLRYGLLAENRTTAEVSTSTSLGA